MIVAFFLLINILLAILVDAYASVKVCSHVDIMGMQHQFVDFGAEKSPGPPNR